MNWSSTQIRNAKHNEPAIRKCIKDGLGIEQMSAETGFAVATIRRNCDVLGIHIPRKKRAPNADMDFRREQIVEMRARGITMAAIAKHFDITRERVRQVLARECPDFAIPHKAAVVKNCVVCQTLFSGPGNTCSRSCYVGSRKTNRLDRDAALVIMGLRDKKFAWHEVAEHLHPGCNAASWRSRLQREAPFIMSTQERERYMSGAKCGAIQIETPKPKRFSLVERIMHLLDGPYTDK